ncbi:hypothetical protein [Streptomyces corynorhini]|uniref:Uncharacterized protein n=1 Tax=Streptomyces corynorhini TaxID=2282652 RepID=A0A370B4Q3_9ACTN|nr:hypothetical protein [Streptomyces corynorhini]RDG34716.1 hypothetical protein DVH02_29100 [Streptomyces corynorhini]
MAGACGGSSTPIDTSRLTDREKEWVEFSYAQEKNEDTRRAWEELPAEDVKSYLDQQRPGLCADPVALMRSLKDAGYEAGEMREYKEKTAELIC